ncbi:hypothetical protein LTR10_019267 [Elasticomyces elasticus]|uniref:Acid phosphatase n=1 Tax=Exophiala sideris TaxID=1016849 RepID=A0ABR0IXC0_9EURO|nr:hypothetical protein LTR10_019267 [Elasticomyces elasticus]KAK5021945.1 hypothetical protein LTS07_010527 [Exophiala sideris]KAK5026008.1 hypothetical protein LTR13_010165 [Exophiala sideris]KAK5050695.1 hypothetical protein LTR69_010551 [Exophiala sideris]KAK5177180.1 hypothetical protein LTR44_010308 [Eurotiomycetes sp. CCFEE 6388]
MLSSAVLLLAAGHLAAAVPAASSASRPAETTVEPSLTAIQSAEATVKPVTTVWLENIDFQSAAGDPNMAWLATQGITLSNYYATTHPSEPNYCAAAGGDNFGMDNDDFNTVPANVSTIVDLLDTKSISWAEYQEDLPYAGFTGFNYSTNQKTYANDYVRKHNPLVFYDSVTNNATRARQMKSFVDFETDLKNQQLPQWAFFTPNMTNDAHDTNITFGAKWERSFMAPLLNNSYFMNDTLILLTFDENSSYGIANKVFSILVGGAIPENLKGTVDATFYNHYSTIATISENWGLPSLGRWDCNANVFDLVASKTGKSNAVLNFNDKHVYFNASYPGPLSDALYSNVWPIPTNSSTCANGKGVLPSIVKTYAGQKATFNYTSVYPYDALTGLDVPSQ